jgi:NAD(P)-dependent dehydrogenase (short-subunit alcohol dehydrogenase family)
MRGLWVIGVSDANLGREVGERADSSGRYDEVLLTDEQQCDVGTYDNIYVFAKRFLSEFDELEVAYCAGVNLLDQIEKVDEADLHQTFDVNVMGFIRVLGVLRRVVGPVLLSVVAVASDAARVPMRNSITYCASKAALVQAVRVAARELAPLVRVNAVSPAIIADTPMTWALDKAVQAQRGWSEEEALAYERSLIPMGRRATKAEVAQVILQTLAGPDFMTGANIEITGGK